MIKAVFGFGNNNEIVKALIQAGADVNATTHTGQTVLMIAVRENDINSVKLLIQAGADVNAKDVFGETALTIANKYKHTEIIDILKETNAAQ